MRQLTQWTARYRRGVRTAVVAVDPGEDDQVMHDDELLDSLDQELRRDFARAAVTHARARRQQQTKDTAVHRRAVQDSAARIDALLDMYLMNLVIHDGAPAMARP